MKTHNPLFQKKRRFNFCILGFLIPFLGMGLTILLRAILYESNSSSAVFSMLNSDSYHQYFPFFKAYRDALRSGGSLLFTWDMGMGMDYLGIISYYLGSPLNLFSVLVPDSLLVEYFTFLNPLRIGFAGLFFSLMLQKIFHKNDLSIALFASFYATCAWVQGYMWNIMWMDTFALLPLVVLGTFSLLTDRKFVLYTVSLFLSVAINYYVGFFTCIFTLLVFICFQICRWQSFKKFAVDLGLMAGFTVIAIGMTAFISLPTLASLQQTSSSINEFPDGFQINHYLPAKATVTELKQEAADFLKSFFPNIDPALGTTTDWNQIFVKSSLFSIREYVGSDLYTSLHEDLSNLLCLFDGMKQSATNTFALSEANNVASEGLPNISSGIFANIFVFLFLTSPQVKKRDRICGIALLLFMNASFIIRQLDYIWHGFHFPNMIPYRFSFLYSFLMLFMGYRAWLLRRRMRPWQVLTAIGLTVLLFISSNAFGDFTEWIDDPANNGNFFSTLLSLNEASLVVMCPVINFLFILGYLAGLLVFSIRLKPKANVRKAKRHLTKLIWYKKLRTRRRLASWFLVGLLCAEFLLNVAFFGTSFTIVNLSHYPRGKEDSARIIEIMKQREDELFYRTETTHTQTYNDGALNGYYGITTFSSSANVNVTNYMRCLGYGAQGSWNRYAFEEGSPISNMFLNLKYMIERQGKLKKNPYFTDLHHSGQVHLLENNYYLPLGFLVDPALADYDVMQNPGVFTTQNDFLSAALGTTVDPWTAVCGDNVSIASTENVTVSNISTSSVNSCKYKADAKGGSVFYTFTFDQEGFFCVRYYMPKRNSITVSYDDGSGYKTLYTEEYSIPFMMSVCQVQPGDRVQITLKCKANESGSLQLHGGLLDEYQVRDAHADLSRSTLSLTTFEDTFIEGTIDCHEDGLLYTSIPHCGNWEVSVDGEPAEVTLIGNAMTGVMLTEGTHTVTFQYRNKAFTLGCVVSIVCALSLAGLYWYVYHFQKKKKSITQ